MKFRPYLSRARLAACAATSVLLLLAACGGGGGAPESSQPAPVADQSPRPLAVTGTVTGFGSVIIDGVRYDDTGTTVKVDDGTDAGTSVPVSDLKLGMTVDAQVEAGKLTNVTVRAAIAGAVGRVDLAASAFTIYGQTIKVATTGATPTLFEGVANLAGLLVGDVVEVHGSVDDSRAIVASRVERRPRGALTGTVRIGGAVTALDSAARTFRFNDLTVDYGDARVSPADLSLANGQFVVVFGDAAPIGGRFVARTVRIKAAQDGAPAAFGGRITAFASLGDFTVSGMRVDARTATLTGGGAADLAPGLSVAVEGRMSGGVLVADKLRVIRQPIDALASLKGEVTDFLSLSNLRLRGTAVDASTASFVGGTAADLGNGAYVVVQGSVRGDVFRAERIEFLPPPAALPVRISGEMRDWSASARTFKLVALTVRLGDGVVFDGGTSDRLATGRRVSVVGVPDAAGVVVASRIVFQADAAGPASTVLGGRAYDVAASSLQLTGVTITHSSTTVFEGGTHADIVNGALVFAKGQFDAASKSLFATWIEVVKGNAPAARVAGTVSDFVSVADLRIGGQRVDASGARFVDGQVSMLTDGRLVMATGEMAERDGVRVFVATQLRFMQ